MLLRFGVCGWMLNLFVFPSGVSLLLRFGGVWVDVNCVVILLLFMVWGRWVDVNLDCFLLLL